MSNASTAIKRYLKELDWWMVGFTLALVAIGFFAIFSATSETTMRYVTVQALALVIGLAGMVYLSWFDYTILANVWKIIFILCLAAIGITILFGIGDSVGQRNWLQFGRLNVQPSEFVKIGFIITLATHLTRVKEQLHSLRAVVLLCVHGGIVIGAILLQGDAGMATVFIFIFLAMTFFAGVQLRYYFIGAGLAVVATPLLWKFVLTSYQKMRILVTLDPSLDPSGIGYQVLRSKIAIGSGQIFGKGMLGSTQNRYGLLPASHTDFIYAVLGEETGLIGCTVVLILFMALTIRLYIQARNANDTFGANMLCGISAVFMIQAIINIGMCVGLMPVIGITLPFLSYGGSSLLSGLLLVGLALGISRRQNVGFFSK